MTSNNIDAESWDDCLEVVGLIIANSKDLKDAERKVKKLKVLIKSSKNAKLRHIWANGWR